MRVGRLAPDDPQEIATVEERLARPTTDDRPSGATRRRRARLTNWGDGAASTLGDDDPVPDPDSSRASGA